MSYDLYFTSPRISLAQFDSYFAEYPLYKCSSGEAIYQNDRTGVYFIFRYEEENPSGEEGPTSWATFNLNYIRPHYFGLEAAPELARFIQRFGLSVFDPQTHGMAEGTFTIDGFLRGWNHGNEFGYSATLRSGGGQSSIFSMPADRLEEIWRWNFAVQENQKALTENIFVPRAFFATIDGSLVSAAVWPDAIPELIPEVDYLFVGRRELAPKPLFKKQQPDKCIIPFSEARDLLAPYRTTDYPISAYKFVPSRHKAHQDFVLRLKPTQHAVKIIPYDQILNREIVEKFGRI